MHPKYKIPAGTLKYRNLTKVIIHGTIKMLCQKSKVVIPIHDKIDIIRPAIHKNHGKQLRKIGACNYLSRPTINRVSQKV